MVEPIVIQAEEKEEVDEFIDWLELRRLASRTITEYIFYYKKFERMKGELSQEKVEHFLHRYKSGLAKACVWNYIRFRNRLEIMLPETRGRKPQKVMTYLTKEEVETLMKGEEARNQIMIALLFEGGLRINELLNIGRDDIDLEGRKIKILGKGSKERYIYFSVRTQRWLSDYINFIMGKDEKLINITACRAFQLIQKWGREKLNKKISPHTLRHSSATFLLEKGNNLEDVRKYLGHANINTTQRYLHVSGKELHKKFDEVFDFD